MAKKQYTPEEYKAKLEKKAEKNKKFSSTFLKVLAFCLAIAMVYCATSIANIRMGKYSLGAAGSVVAGNQNNEGGESVDNNDSMDWGDSNDTQTPSTDNNADSNNTVNDNSGNTNNDANNNAGNEEKPAANVMTSPSMQFDLFVKAFTGVKTNAKSATFVKKNAYNYNNHVVAGMLSSVAQGLVSSIFKEEEVGQTYTDADIAANFPPAGATCGLTKDDVKNITCKEEGNYYIITVTVKGSVNPVAGQSVGSVASIITKESIQEPISSVPGLNKIEPRCDYKDTTVEAKIEKESGNLVEYYFNLPMILYMDSYEIGLGFEEWWTVAY